MRKKKLILLISILFLISPIVISIWIIPNTLNFLRIDDQGEFTNFKIETPKLSSGHRWILDGIGISTAAYDQESPQIASDGEGGALITWLDSRISTNEIFAQKVDSYGDIQWQRDGKLVSTATSSQYNPLICSDGSGGAIITWYDYRNGNADIYAQRIDSIGNALWIYNGIAVCNATGNQYNQQIISDGSGGAIITWRDARNTNFDIYAQRIDSNGNTQWINNGTAICTNIETQNYPLICSDGAEGAIITWRDSRNGNYDIYAQRINSTGSTQWIDNGTALCTDYSYQYGMKLISDGSGGAIITWYDYRNGASDIFAQLVDLNGNTQWTANGTVVCGDSNEQIFPQICSDDVGGAIISWDDWRGSEYDIYAQRINSTGDGQWIINGVAMTSAVDTQSGSQISSDGKGGAIITWTDHRDIVSGYDIYAQKVNSNGDLLLTEDGAPICKADGVQHYPQICSNGIGSAIITWEDERGAFSDIYAQRVFNYTGAAELTVITPESKLYTGPMGGYYPATYGFENDEIGDDPSDWTVNETGGAVQIIASHLGHTNVIELHETSDDLTEIYNNIGSKTSGTVEWWASVNRIDDWFELGIYDGDSTDGIHMSFANDGYLKYHDGSVWTVIMPYSANMWYSFKVEWDSSTDWHLWVNGTSQDAGMGYNYRNSPSSLNRVRFQISDTGVHQDQYLYADAVGYSWDSNYKLGDNWNEGLLLGFELNSSIFRLDYSLDNQANVSIAGNTTLVLPKDGPHSIKVHGTTFFRDFAQSETKNFIVDTKIPEIVIHSPNQGDTAGDKPPYFMVSIIEANIVSKWYTIDDGDNNFELLSLFGLIDKDAWLATPLGPVTIRIYVEDVAGNIVSEHVTINKTLEMPISLIFNIAIISMFVVIGALVFLTFREINIPRER